MQKNHALSYRLINPRADASFIFKWEPFDLTTRWHYHPELELIYFIEGKSTGVIGDGFKEFTAGDLVLLGPNFPHVLQENRAFAQQFPHAQPFGLIIQFLEHFMGESFLQLPEMKPIHMLFERSRRGLRFWGEPRQQAVEILAKMPQMDNTEKLLRLLEVLVILAKSAHFEYLTHQDYYFDYSQDEDRMRKINEYVYKNFREKISVADIASIANLSETAFCRYFRTRTLKNFTQYLTEIRISYACKLLQNPNCNVAHACFESGFNNLSYFHRTFRQILHMTPLDYQRLKWGN